jgi:hypothetical protein
MISPLLPVAVGRTAVAAAAPTLVGLQVNATDLGVGNGTTATLTVLMHVTGMPAGGEVNVFPGSPWSYPGEPAGLWAGTVADGTWRVDLPLGVGAYDLEVLLYDGVAGHPPLADYTAAMLSSMGLPNHVNVNSSAPGSVTTFHRSGYWLSDPKGNIYAFGDAPYLGPYGPLPASAKPFVALLHRPGASDYVLFDQGGGGWEFYKPSGGYVAWSTPYTSYCEAPAPPAGQHYVTAVLYPDAGGCWAFTDKGYVASTDPARNYGDTTALTLNGPIIDAVATPSGKGYYLVASDGGVFSFGDAQFYGSMGGKPLNGPVVGLVPDYDNVGYWLVATDGGVFSFQADFHGSMGGKALNKPMVGMVRYGGGYLMVAADGGVFNFSNLPFAGSLGGSPPTIPITRITPLDE